MSILEVNNVSKSFGGVKANVDISMSVEKGKIFGLIGPNGSGKTTFLNSIGGLDSPTKGQVLIDNKDITKLNSNELIDFRLKNIGFVFQSYNLIPVLTAKENVEFIMLMQGDLKLIRDKRSKELLEAVGLNEHLNRRPNQLSGGQQQRVAVARALASKPKFVLADEPTANLDSENSHHIMEIMKKYHLKK